MQIRYFKIQLPLFPNKYYNPEILIHYILLSNGCRINESRSILWLWWWSFCLEVEVDVPIPKADEVLLKVEAASLNAIDWKIQMGLFRPFLPRKFPYIQGTDVAGEVVQIGSAVNKFKDGDKVIAMLSHVTGGALAEYAVAKEKLIVARPPQVSAPEGAGLPLAALTAHTALTLANIPLNGTNGETKNVLITAASGGVGHYAVQLSKLGNTCVTATCGARNLDLVKDLGANEVLDYKTPEGASLKSPSGKKYDCVIHCASGIPWATFKPNLSETGKVIDLTPGLNSIATFAMQKLTFSKQQLVPVLFPNTESFECVVNLANEGKAKTVVDSKYSLNNVDDAWSRIMSGHAIGKIVIEV